MASRPLVTLLEWDVIGFVALLRSAKDISIGAVDLTSS
jgi:hypothetical protein